MTPYEKATIAAFHHLWDTWNPPTATSVQESINVWAETCKGFGTGLTEIWHKKDFRQFCEQAFAQNPSGFKTETKWLETEHLAEDLVAIWGEIAIIVEQPSKDVVIDPIRCTGVFKQIEGQMKMIRWHSSVPDVSSEGELWPGTGEPTFYEATSILFTDFVGFTDMVANISPQTLVDELNEIFAAFDVITHQHGLDKVKTIGDAYMAVGGLNYQPDHAIAAVQVAKEMLAFLGKRNQEKNLQWNMRVGVHSGPVVGGVIGSQKLAFDLWGDTVNIANRVEQAGAANKINISVDTHHLIKNTFHCTPRGEIHVKGKGAMEMYFVG